MALCVVSGVASSSYGGLFLATQNHCGRADLRSGGGRRRRVWVSSASSEAPLRKEKEEKGIFSMASPPCMEFPFLSAAGRALMEDIAALMERDIGSSLNPSRTPPHVRSFLSPDGSSQGSVVLRSGKDDSKVDFTLGSWIHCNLPFGELNIATLLYMLNLKTDAPHFLLEFIQSGPNNLVLAMDLLPRKDLVLHYDYFERFYRNTDLEMIRQELVKSSNAQPYISSELFIRSFLSPTALFVQINSEKSNDTTGGSLDTIVSNIVHPAVAKIREVWLEGLMSKGGQLEGAELEILKRRDTVIKTKGIEVDLSANLPKLFGQDIADKVVEAFFKGE